MGLLALTAAVAARQREEERALEKAIKEAEHESGVALAAMAPIKEAENENDVALAAMAPTKRSIADTNLAEHRGHEPGAATNLIKRCRIAGSQPGLQAVTKASFVSRMGPPTSAARWCGHRTARTQAGEASAGRPEQIRDGPPGRCRDVFSDVLQRLHVQSMAIPITNSKVKVVLQHMDNVRSEQTDLNDHEAPAAAARRQLRRPRDVAGQA